MVKKSVLTPVLASVVAVAAVGTGITYVALNKDKDNTEEKTTTKKVVKELNEGIETVQKAIKGELDFAYDANVKVTVDKSLTNEDIKSAELSSSTKQKGKKAQTDLALNYDDKQVISLKTILDRDTKTGYAQVSELSDGYLYANSDDLQKVLEQYASQYKDAIDQLDKQLEDSKVEFDADKFEKSLNEYEKTFKDALPEAKDGDKLKGDIDGVSYSYTTKSYTLTGKDAANGIKAVLEKAKEDDTLKTYYEDRIVKAAKTAGNTDIPSYSEFIDEAVSDLGDGGSDSDKKADVDVYYDGDDLRGFKLVPESEEAELRELTFIVVDTKENCGIDFKLKSDDADEVTLYGVVKLEDNKANGDYKFAVKESGKDLLTSTTSIKDVATNDKCSGTVRTDISFSSDETFGTVAGKNFYTEVKADSDDDKSEITFDLGMDDKSLVKVEFSGKKTEASDIEIPKDNLYKATDEEELKKYVATIDQSKFTENVKNALGEELYKKLIGSNTYNSGSSNDDSALTMRPESNSTDENA